MRKNFYLKTLEALNMRKRKNIVFNKLNEVYIYANDPMLQSLVKKTMDALMKSSTNTENTPLIEFNFVDTKKLQQLCNDNKSSDK
jgi:hypothetical protein